MKQSTPTRALFAAAALLAGCSLPPYVPEPHDGGPLSVPETYHLARSSPGHKQHLALTGDKQLRCHDCHALADAGFFEVPVSMCVNCHEAQVKQHHREDAGVHLEDGGLAHGLTCFSCHPFLPSAPSMRFEKWSCYGCHQRDQGDAGAITVHTNRCSACHHPHEKPFTQPQDCTTCHDVSLKHGAKGTTIADTCMKCHKHHTQAEKASVVCVNCHTKPTMELRARVATDALFDPGHTGCGSCHRPHSFVKEEVSSCQLCHQSRHVLAPKDHDSCTSCHFPHASRAAAKDCQGCHDDQKVKHPKDKQGKTCTGCHPPHDGKLGKAVAHQCLDCHKEPELNASVVHAASAECTDCHKPHDGKPKLELLCPDCHKQWKQAASNKNKAHVKCESCHKGLPHKEMPEPPECVSCHKAKVPTFAGHRTKDVGCLTCHTLHDAQTVKTCKDCHDAAKLPTLHQVAKHQDCRTCHAPHEPQPGFGPATCAKGGCHEKLSVKDHPPKPTQCVGCHLFREENPDKKKP